MKIRHIVVSAVVAAFSGISGIALASDISTYSGACDASGAVSLGDGRFLVVDNEDEVLRVYEKGRSDPIDADMDIRDVLNPYGGDYGKKRADLEGIAKIGDLFFIIGSHGDNKEGELRANRHVLFAVRIEEGDGGYSASIQGQPYRLLRSDIEAHPLFRQAQGYFNIEGLAATPEGHLLVGFREPLVPHDDKEEDDAVIFEILNPKDLMAGKRTNLGRIHIVNLEGRGIRSLMLDEAGQDYLISAGPKGDNENDVEAFKLFRWQGPGDRNPKQVNEKDWLSSDVSMTPEAIFTDETGEIYILSDDGEQLVSGAECKELKDDDMKRFRGLPIKLDE